MSIEPHPVEARSPQKRGWLLILGIVVSATCLYLGFRKVDWYQMLDEFSLLHWHALTIAFSLYLGHIFLSGFRWHLILKPLGKIGFWQSFWCLRISYFFNSSLPARAGEAFRIYFLQRRTQIRLSHAIGALAGDRLADFIGLLTLFYLSILVLGSRGYEVVNRIALPSVIAALIVILGFRFLPKKTNRPWIQKLLDLKSRLVEGMTAITNLKVALVSGCFSLLSWTLSALMILFIAADLDMPMSIFKAYIVLLGINLAIALPATPGNLGTFELGAIAGLSLFGVPMEKAATIAIVYHLVQLLPTLVIGSLGYYFYYLKTSSPKEAQDLNAQNIERVKL